LKGNSVFDRMRPKSLEGLLTAHFQENYKLPPKAAQTICQDVVLARSVFACHPRGEGQIIHYAVKLGQSPSRSIKECEMLSVKLTLVSREDLDVVRRDGLKALGKNVMVRVCEEAYRQGAVLSTEDVAFLLRISERTVKRYKKELSAAGRKALLRGDTSDMGPASTHRAPVIELFLQGYPETKIAERLHHDLSNVENYIRDFLRVSLLLAEGYDSGSAGRVTQLSRGKVRAISELFGRLCADSYFAGPLSKVLEMFRLNRRVVEEKGGLA
jgi:hypothetical protein